MANVLVSTVRSSRRAPSHSHGFFFYLAFLPRLHFPPRCSNACWHNPSPRFNPVVSSNCIQPKLACKKRGNGEFTRKALQISWGGGGFGTHSSMDTAAAATTMAPPHFCRIYQRLCGFVNLSDSCFRVRQVWEWRCVSGTRTSHVQGEKTCTRRQ